MFILLQCSLSTRSMSSSDKNELESSSEPEEFAAVVYAEPGALALIANTICAVMVAIENMQEIPPTPSASVMSGRTTHYFIIAFIKMYHFKSAISNNSITIFCFER